MESVDILHASQRMPSWYIQRIPAWYVIILSIFLLGKLMHSEPNYLWRVYRVVVGACLYRRRCGDCFNLQLAFVHTIGTTILYGHPSVCTLHVHRRWYHGDTASTAIHSWPLQGHEISTAARCISSRPTSRGADGASGCTHDNAYAIAIGRRSRSPMMPERSDMGSFHRPT